MVLCNLLLKICHVPVSCFTTFECLALSISTPHISVIVTVYRSPRPNTEFLSEFADLFTMRFKYSRFLILGDFNIHVDQEPCIMAKDFLSMLDCYNLTQYVHFPKCTFTKHFHC